MNLNGWSLCGGGLEGECYVKNGDRTKFLKLYRENSNSEQADREYELSKAAYRLGIPVPRPYEVVMVGKRKGIIFSYIHNARSFCRVISEQPERFQNNF